MHADVRLIKSLLYASELSLRFPRVAEVRNDKRPLDIQTIGEIREMVHGNRPDAGEPPAPGVLGQSGKLTGACCPCLRWQCSHCFDEVGYKHDADELVLQVHVLSCMQGSMGRLT